jgi:hypothetical protein
MLSCFEKHKKYLWSMFASDFAVVHELFPMTEAGLTNIYAPCLLL